MVFNDRSDAGRQLAEHLSSFADRDDVLVLGVPRGGVPVAYEVAKALHAPLDVFLSSKLGVPGHEELAFGAVAASGEVFLDEEIVKAAHVSAEQMERVAAETRRELERRSQRYRGGAAMPALHGKAVILVDDGVATGASLYAALKAVDVLKPAKLVVAVPVASRQAIARLQEESDACIAVHTPQHFYAVGRFYRDFRATSDEDVIRLLREGMDVAEPEAGGWSEVS